MIQINNYDICHNLLKVKNKYIVNIYITNIKKQK